MNDALVLIFSRNIFYKRLHYLALALFGFSLIVIFGLGALLYLLLAKPNIPLYFPADNVGRLTKVIPVSEPNMGLNDVMNWTVKAVQKSYSFDYINYRGQIQFAQRYFTTYGWNTYLSALQLSGNLTAVTEAKRIAIAQVVETPKLLAEGILSGAYAWKFEMPLYVIYLEPPYDDKSSFSTALKVTVLVQRQKPLEGNQGLGIVQLIIEMG